MAFLRMTVLSARPAALAVRAGLLSLLAAVALWEAVPLAQRTPAPAPAHPGPAASAGSQKTLSSLPMAAQGAISAALGADGAAYRMHVSGARVSASNPEQHFRASFSAAGTSLRTGRTTVGLRLLAFGDGARQQPVTAASPHARGNRVTFARGALNEWYANGPLGLEQGFTLAHAPAGGSAGPVTLTLLLTGTTRATVTNAGRSLTLGAGGSHSLSYAGLTATDARGQTLHSWLELRGTRLLIRVDTRSAQFPIRIDPLLQEGLSFGQQGSKLTGGGESGKGEFAASVALSADGSTVLIGAPGDNGGTGAAWVFVRSGSTWAQQGSKLAGAEASGAGHFGVSVAVSANGNTALIGGYLDNTFAGAAWVFTRSGSTWTQQGSKLTGGGESGSGFFGSSVALSSDGNTALIGGFGDNGNIGAAWIFTRSLSAWTQQGSKLTGSGEVGTGEFGRSVALSGNGNTALIGGLVDNNNIGAAWVFTRSGSAWSQQGAKLTGGGETGKGEFGFDVAVSADGDTALVGAYYDNGGIGAAWVFTRSGATWTQQGEKLTGGGEVESGRFGISVALSADGNVALIGGFGDNTGVGAAWVFTHTGFTWTQQGSKLTGSGESAEGGFGRTVALSPDGNVALVGGYFDNSSVGAAWVFAPKLAGAGETGAAWTGVSTALSADGNTVLVGGYLDNSSAGAAWVFTRSGTTWAQQGSKLTGSGESGAGRFGTSVALSADGNTALIGGYIDNSAGAAWVFTRSGSTWTQQGSKLTGGSEIGSGSFGASVALSADGNTALIGGNNDNAGVGAAWVFTRSGSTWTQQGEKLKGGGESGEGGFGQGVALSENGNTALIGGYSDNGFVGAAWVFTRSGSTWTQQGEKLTGSGESGLASFGISGALSADGNTALIGGYNDNSASGAAWVFTRSGSTWTQQGSKLTATGEGGAGKFGTSVALSANGNTALIGGSTDESEVGAAWLFARVGTTWSQQGEKLAGGGESGKGHFGSSVALSAEGSTALVGGPNDNASVGAAWVFVSPPTITKLKNTNGPVGGGTTVTITGTGFSGAWDVLFGSTSAASFKVTSPTTMTAVSPEEAAGTVDVVVEGLGGPSAITTKDHFKVLPTVTNVSPKEGTHEGGTTVTITGTGFALGKTATTFKFGTSKGTGVNCTSSTECTVVSPVHAAGVVDITATVSKSVSAKTAADKYTYT